MRLVPCTLMAIQAGYRSIRSDPMPDCRDVVPWEQGADREIVAARRAAARRDGAALQYAAAAGLG